MLFSEISIKIFLKRIKADTERQGCVETNFEIKFFKTANGREPVREYLKDMALTNEKVTRDTLDTISELLMMLKAKGNALGEPCIKHLQGPIWELRPKNRRILYCCILENQIYLLHIFKKTTQKTPKKDIQKALSRYKLLIGR